MRDGQIAYASDIHIARFVNVISIFLAAMLLIGAIIGLYVVESPKKRLAMLATFTVLFAIGVGLLTNARKPELFAATAASVDSVPVLQQAMLTMIVTRRCSLCSSVEILAAVYAIVPALWRGNW